VELFPIELPAMRIAFGGKREAFEFVRVGIGVGVSSQLCEKIPHQLISLL
jgi:hypothetical protein